MSERIIPVDARFLRWLAGEIAQIQHGSIHLEIEEGKLRWIGCHGHRFFNSSDDLKESAT
jgi:hypothetical protein